MQLEALIKKYKRPLIDVAVIILSLVVTQNTYKKQDRNIQMLREKKDAEIKKNEVLGKISQSEKLINSYKAYLNKKDISLIINTLSNIAKDSNLKVGLIKPVTEEKYPVYVRYPFDLVLSAENYHAIGKFISNLENHPDIYFVDTVNIQPAGKPTQGQDQPYSLVLNVRISTIVFK